MSKRVADRNRSEFWEWVPVQPVPDPKNFWTDEEKKFIASMKSKKQISLNDTPYIIM